MKWLFVGVGSGSWQMRGVQLGAALGARVTSDPTPGDWAWADVVVLVKRAAIKWQQQARRVAVPVVWDVLDFWDQPGQNAVSCADLAARIHEIEKAAGVDLLIGATQRMAADIGGVYLPHHCRIGLAPSPIRKKASVVAYDGTKKYLGSWAKALAGACDMLGLTFVINPTDLGPVDVFVSFRDGRWDGDVCRQWKSGVKYVNAIAAGRPVLTQPSAAFSELPCNGVTAAHQDDLVGALNRLTWEEERQTAYEASLVYAPSFTVDAVAAQYRQILERVARKAA